MPNRVDSLFPVELAHVKTAVVHPRLLDILFGHGIPRLYFSKRQCQLPIPSFPIRFHEYLRRRALERVVHGLRAGWHAALRLESPEDTSSPARATRT